jgi:hypothetical protein
MGVESIGMTKKRGFVPKPKPKPIPKIHLQITNKLNL